MSPETFSAEISRFLAWRDVNFPDVMIRGFRAPTFSLDEKTAWAIPILREHGFEYDSSIFPARTPLYGVPDAPRHAYHISPENLADEAADGLLEIPMSVFDLFGGAARLHRRVISACFAPGCSSSTW